MERSAVTLTFDDVFPFLRSIGLGARLPSSVGEADRSLQCWEEKPRNMVDYSLANSAADAKLLLSPITTGVDGFLGGKLNHKELVEEAMGYMFTGSGTRSFTLTYLLYALSLPENTYIQEELRDEIRNIPADDECSSLLHIGETLVLVNTVVGMQNWTHHRNPEVFLHPDQFLQARWFHNSEAMEGSLTRFRIGPRNCIGQNLGKMKMVEMEMEDRFNIVPRGRRLMLEIEKITLQ
ncbi:cytochrome P450 [Paraphoma chrysanthemicola]|uniref:Cytochrome P450 n=1 Tax=Paraphoma chrysanthemicola TaxID=798071 RepID=A0A8K0QS38_9PLEO|nr:cytochrome P450 [Paraphoma chrysanthemicola]